MEEIRLVVERMQQRGRVAMHGIRRFLGYKKKSF